METQFIILPMKMVKSSFKCHADKNSSYRNGVRLGSIKILTLPEMRFCVTLNTVHASILISYQLGWQQNLMCTKHHINLWNSDYRYWIRDSGKLIRRRLGDVPLSSCRSTSMKTNYRESENVIETFLSYKDNWSRKNGQWVQNLHSRQVCIVTPHVGQTICYHEDNSVCRMVEKCNHCW